MKSNYEFVLEQNCSVQETNSLFIIIHNLLLKLKLLISILQKKTDMLEFLSEFHDG